MISSLKKNDAMPCNNDGKIVCPLMKIWRKKIGNLCNINQIRIMWKGSCTDFVKCLPYEFVQEANLFNRFGNGTPCLKIPDNKKSEIETELAIFLENRVCYHIKQCSIASDACTLQDMKTCQPIFIKESTG